MRPFSPAPSLSRPLAERRPLFELAAEDLFPATIPSIASPLSKPPPRTMGQSKERGYVNFRLVMIYP